MFNTVGKVSEYKFCRFSTVIYAYLTFCVLGVSVEGGRVFAFSDETLK